MRVLLDCRMTEWGGVGRYSKGLTRALAQLPDIEIVQLVASGVTAPVPDAAAVSAAHHPFSIRGALEYAAAARRVAPDVTHSLHFPVPLPARGPLVVTVQDLTPLIVPGVMPSALRRAVYRRSIRRATRVSDRIITPSQHSASDLGTFFPSVAGRVTPVLLAADDFTSGPVGDLPAWLVGRRYVLSMGNTKPHKDLPTLLRSFAALAEDDLMLVLSGSDPGAFARGMLGESPAAERIRFTGPISDDELRALYAHAALLAFPSRYEGFGLPPLEAMAFGAPVVVADAASLPEVVGEAALLVGPGDASGLTEAMSRVLNDEALARELSQRGRIRAAEFSWTRTAEQTFDIYRLAVSR